MIYRKAKREDIPIIIKMLVTDKLGKLREKFDDPLPESYYTAFHKIDNDPQQELIVMENEEGEVIGTLQLSYLQYLTYQGGLRAQIESVRIKDDYTGKGYGTEFLKWAVTRAKDKGAHVVQLTSDKKRPEAIQFYKRLGFKDSHEGMKLHL
ncbi:GNAT family N-acetyltransferase [Abyssalbus ytuae]|uniref:GNAT family N-acetyltransferase n=1 Tax=Abyssalbus ytuae TaxID=2926907 RepID=A0A9E6ZMI5_9FLAO|nr:GNAT family N-acetyltransferase [Abyssalbus ytuae]UOB17045.1 GNAT family N-acetyltransferase [Abyssalbus ytuae]